MKGLRSSGDGGQVTSHLGHLNLHHRATTIIGQAGHTAGQVAHGPAARVHGGDDDLIDRADDQLKTQGTKTVKAASRSVKATAEGTIKAAGKRSGPLVKQAVQDGIQRVGREARLTAETVRGAGRATRGPAMGTRAVKGGVVAATRRAATRRAAAKAQAAATKRVARTGMRTARSGAATTRQAIQAAAWSGRLAAAAISALSSTPGLIAAAIAVAVAAAIMAVLSIIPGIGHEADQQRPATVAIPAQYLDAVTQAGSICPEITPNLIAAQVNQESGWNPDATSPAGAQGISQFMPGTWASVGVDGDGDGRADVWNPTDAILTQGHYMCGLVDQVKTAIAAKTITGDVVSLALAAYNAGLGAVTAAGGIPAFIETQNYVATILAASSQSTDEGGVSADVADAVEWAKSVAADDTYAYVWGGNGRQDGGYDCSGLTSAVYRRLGISLPRTAAQQQQVGTGIERGELKVGDLIFYGTPAYHVAIYAGNGWMVSADNSIQGINFEPIYGSPSSYRRIQ
ncbi:NlpC/P60 family protein [Schaalia hyovaginalis]|uniref:Cell wall-associated NlpC family hydrolase n=1 Tax=Schaalia hyovaginalis TaxID=29316 RepID=A0A923IY90_9ACTO|nr:bifunctional lytic transglycosylase/C40 family peptidase [Schaalia hyovaginalis]MBB6335782.1 cell wall-associated NlpC family hydrolase [Schaalia hyovaginalis]